MKVLKVSKLTSLMSWPAIHLKTKRGSSLMNLRLWKLIRFVMVSISICAVRMFIGGSVMGSTVCLRYADSRFPAAVLEAMALWWVPSKI